MKFMFPQWLWGCAVAPVLCLALWLWCGREFRRRLGAFVGARMRTSQLTSRALLRKRVRILLLSWPWPRCVARWRARSAPSARTRPIGRE